jgi:hypothetical protein
MIPVGFTGLAGVGKSTCAKMLLLALAEWQFRSEIISFADPLKRYAKILGWNGEKDEKGRRLLQLLGTECGRECIDPDLWVKKWEIAANSKNTLHVVISDDVRFDNEAKKIHDMGGIVIHVARLIVEPSLFRHASEAGVSKELIDRFLINDGTIEEIKEFFSSVIAAAKEHRLEYFLRGS